MKSKIGLTLAVAFALIAIAMDIYAFTCGQMFCGIGVLFTALPWAFMSLDFLDFLDDLFDNSTLFVYQLFNALLLYLIGLAITIILNRWKGVNQHKRKFETVVQRAKELATKAHEGHTEKDEHKTPYIFHVEKVAQLVEQSGGTPEEIAAAWLHDTVEDTFVTFEDIEREFGGVVLEIVRGLTDLPEFEGLSVDERKQRQLERIMRESDSVRRVKLADQISAVELDSANTLLDIEHRRKYIEGAKRIAEVCKGISTFLDHKFEGAYNSASKLLNM